MIYEVFRFESDLLPFKYSHQRVMNNVTYSHWHEEIELIYVTEGAGYGHNNSEKIHLEKGDVFVANSGEVHSFGSDDIMKYHCIIISEKFLRKNGIDITKVNFCHFIRDKEIAGSFEEINSVLKKENDFLALYFRTAILRLFCKMAENYVADTSTLPYYNSRIINSVKGVINYIHENFKEKIKIEEILEESGFSRAYFSREFKKITGNSIVDYINFVRCSRTEELISTGDYIISEAAEMCGFSSMSYFSKTYKKFMGRLPSETVKKN